MLANTDSPSKKSGSKPKRPTKRKKAPAKKRAPRKPAAKSEAKPAQEQAPKAGRGRPRKRSAALDMKSRDLTRRAKAGDPQALDALCKIVDSYRKMAVAQAAVAEVKRDADQIEGTAAVSFENTITKPIPDKSNEVFTMLQDCQFAYQALVEAQAKAKEMRDGAKDKAKKLAKAFDQAMTDSAQLTLSGVD